MGGQRVGWMESLNIQTESIHISVMAPVAHLGLYLTHPDMYTQALRYYEREINTVLTLV